MSYKKSKRNRAGIPCDGTLTYSLVRSHHPDFPEVAEYKLCRAIINRIADDISVFAHWRRRGMKPDAESLRLYREGWDWFHSTAYHSFGIICECADLDPDKVKDYFKQMVVALELPHPDNVLRELHGNKQLVGGSHSRAIAERLIEREMKRL